MRDPDTLLPIFFWGLLSMEGGGTAKETKGVGDEIIQRIVQPTLFETQ